MTHALPLLQQAQGLEENKASCCDDTAVSARVNVRKLSKLLCVAGVIFR